MAHDSTHNQPLEKITALNASSENLVSPKPEISYHKEEMLYTENKYTGDTVHEEKKQETITLKVQEDNQETKMTLNCSVGDLRNKGKQSFGCNICKTYFSSKSDLVVHIESVHCEKKLNEKPSKRRVFHDKCKQKNVL